MDELIKPQVDQIELKPEYITRFVDYIDRSHKTTLTYLSNLKQFAAWMTYSGITQPTREHILLYRQYLSEEHDAISLTPTGWAYRFDDQGNRLRIRCSANTVAQYLRSVRQFFAWTASEGLYPNVAANVHSPKIETGIHRKEALSPSDVLVIEKSIKARAADKVYNAEFCEKDTTGRIERAAEQGRRNYAMFLLAVNAGLRTIEMQRARIRDLEAKAGRYYIYIWGKGHSEADERKPIASEVYEALQDYISHRTDHPTRNSPLFAATGSRAGGQALQARTISSILKGELKAAGYDSERITTHSLRHTAGTNLMRLSGNLYEVQKYMRHKNPATTEIYLHCEGDDKNAELAQQLYDLYHSKTICANDK